MARYEYVEFFKDTRRLCLTEPVIAESIRKSVEGQKLIPETQELPEPEKDRYDEEAQIIVSRKKTFDAAEDYPGQKVAVLNFASATNPGGGVERGAVAQEECLCRDSGLFFCLETPEMRKGFYEPHRAAGDPIHNDDIIYTPGVLVFKRDDPYPRLMPEDQWFHVNVITCAAPNLRNKPTNRYNTGDGQGAVSLTDTELQELHEKRLRRILDVALSEGNDTVILGAFGCGAFKNDPEVVARAANRVIRDYRHAFRNIEFAVYCAPSQGDRNYKIFQKGIDT